jgi:FkbM family methyltransferase
MALPNRQASALALRARVYAAVRDARLDLLPKEVTAELRTCVDAGAHEGLWSQALLRIFRPQRVLLVECEPRLVGYLQNTIGTLPGIQVVNAALSGESGTADFYRLRHPAGSSLLKPREDIGEQFEKKLLGCGESNASADSELRSPRGC